MTEDGSRRSRAGRRMERAALAQRLALAACPGSGRTSFDLLLKTTERESKTSLFFFVQALPEVPQGRAGCRGLGTWCRLRVSHVSPSRLSCPGGFPALQTAHQI